MQPGMFRDGADKEYRRYIDVVTGGTGFVSETKAGQHLFQAIDGHMRAQDKLGQLMEILLSHVQLFRIWDSVNIGELPDADRLPAAIVDCPSTSFPHGDYWKDTHSRRVVTFP